jgi:hypothetical protein
MWIAIALRTFPNCNGLKSQCLHCRFLGYQVLTVDCPTRKLLWTDVGGYRVSLEDFIIPAKDGEDLVNQFTNWPRAGVHMIIKAAPVLERILIMHFRGTFRPSPVLARAVDHVNISDSHHGHEVCSSLLVENKCYAFASFVLLFSNNGKPGERGIMSHPKLNST